MSILIGYWTNRSDPESRCRLQQLLNEVAGPVENRSIDKSAVATRGRNVTLESSPNSLNATISVAGAGRESDIWVKASNDDLILGRDVFGRATLFWTQAETAIWFASRLDLLLRVLKRARVSLDGFYAYGCMSYIPAPLTPIESVFAIPAGNEVTWTTDNSGPPSIKVDVPWREADTQITDEAEAARHLRGLLEESVSAQLDHSIREPVGVLLSGGLDSSVTAALLVRAGANVRAYTLDFGSDTFSELLYAEGVARSLGIPLTKIPVTANTVRLFHSSTATRLDGVYGDGVVVPLAILYQRASEDVRMVFNGEGGDQLFAGWTNKPLITASLYENKAADSHQTLVSHYMRTFHRLHGHETAVYPESVLQLIDKDETLTRVAHALDSTCTKNLLHRLRRANLLLKGADNIQPRATNLGLSYNLDVRTLFCSRSLAAWTFSVSGELWLRGGCEKYLLKRAVEDLLPQEIVWREKRGMGVPLTWWLTGRLRRWTLKQLSPVRLAREGLWQPDLARRIIEGQLSGQVQGRRIGETLWLMLMWQAWREHASLMETQPDKLTQWNFASFRRSRKGTTREVHQV